MSDINIKSLLAIDPGPHLGYVEFRIKPDEPASIFGHGLIHPADFNSAAEVFDEFIGTAPGPALVVCEAWIDIPYTEHAVSTEAVQQQIGVLRYLCQEEMVLLELPNPQARLQIAPETLKSSSYFLQGKDYDHVRQATRHGLSWLVRNHHWPTVNKLYPR